jgi:hypothetical protein
MGLDLATLKADFVKVEGWFLQGLADFAKAEPILDAVAQSIPGCPPIVSKILEALPQVIASAEQALGDGTGDVKMSAVLAFFQNALSAADNTLNVGAGTFFAKIEPALKAAVNSAVAMANANNPATPTTPAT